MPSAPDDRLIALFASFNTIEAYVSVTNNDKEIYSNIIAAITSVHKADPDREQTLDDVHQYFQFGYDALCAVLPIIPENRALKRAMFSCEIAALATVDDRSFDLQAVLNKRAQFREAFA
jgi:hypothetical protein